MKVYLATLGCKLNESELEAWARQFARAGAEIVNDPRDADHIVVNSCTVTHIAARKSRQLVRQLAKHNPDARIVLTGCYATIEPEPARGLPNVARVVPNVEKERLVELVGARCDEFKIQNSKFEIPTPRTRAFVKIQDGCNKSCAFCIIPLARGGQRSRAEDEIIREVRELMDAGYKEIVLTGVQISAYEDAGIQKPVFSEKTGFSRGGLAHLVAHILNETDVPRLRLTSIAPWDMDEALLDLFADRRVCRHLHLSLQSGSDSVLKRMRRAYTSAQYARVVEQAREKIPDVGVTTDVIVGFPGETDVEFKQSLNFVESIGFSRVHVFSYSSREGTLAATMPGQIHPRVLDERARAMQQVADASARRFVGKFVGRTLEVLWEEQIQNSKFEIQNSDLSLSLADSQPPVWAGYSDNYIRVVAESRAELHNRIATAKIVEALGDGARGVLISDCGISAGNETRS